MTRLECNLQTGEQKVITLTPEEETAALAQTAAWAAENTLDARAAKAIDRIDRLQFEHLFNLENEKRDLKAKINLLLPATYTLAESSPITRLQYRAALIARWKAMNP